jgi:hypothetical protein
MEINKQIFRDQWYMMERCWSGMAQTNGINMNQLRIVLDSLAVEHNEV